MLVGAKGQAPRDRASEMCLARACAEGDSTAIERFEHVYFDEVDAVAMRLRKKGVASDELRQTLRERLFLTTQDGAPPRIATYSGEGDLRHWVRVVAMRAVLNATRNKTHEQAGGDDVLLDVADLSDDPELGLMKREYRAELDAAVAAAFEALDPRAQNVLRFATVERLTSAAIGAIYGVHRTTVKRWIEDAEKALVTTIRTAMMERLRVSRAELESILRLVRSGIDLRLAGARN